MSSARDPSVTGGEDRTAAARIRDAAIVRVAACGLRATTIRDVAAAAEVSPALVIHHFGSKAGLRRACDEHVARAVHQRKVAAAAEGPGLDPLAALRPRPGELPLLGYLAASLADGSPAVDALVDDLVADAERTLELAVGSGLARRSDHPQERAAVLTVWSLGALVLRRHLERLLGARLTDGDPEQLRPYLLGALDVLGNGVLTDAAAASGLAELDDQEATS